MPSLDWSSDSEDESQRDSGSDDEASDDGNPHTENEANQESDDSTDSVVDDKPLELIKIHKAQNNDNSQITVQLNQENLDAVLESSEDRPICIISVVGPPRTGKSLLLNYIKLSLEALEDGNKTFDIANVNKAVNGFAWNANYDPQTKGIWVWSRAFLIDTTGKGVAVILLDTQGFNEDVSTPQEISCVLGLSILSSSITIYNLENDIPTEVFKSLATIFQYGSLCKDIDEQCTDDSPFQKLSFLVRDWNNPTKYEHGEEGGKLLLKHKVRSLKGNLKKVTLNAFKNCFHHVDSFLMPNIGQTGLQQTFTGVTTEVDPEFKSHLKSYISSLIGKGNLHTQNILGNNVTASDYASYLKKFCNVFNDSNKVGGKVTEDELLKVRCETLHENIIAKSLGKYHQVMEKKLKVSKYVPESELQVTDKIARNQAKAIFEKSNKLEEFKAEFEKRLQIQLEKACEALMRGNNSSRASYVTECIRVSSENYRAVLTENLPFDNQQITIYEDDYIHSTSQNAMRTVTEDFLEKFLNEDKENIPNLKASLQQVLTSILQPFLERNNQNKNEANLIIADLSSKIFQEYETTMNHLVTDFPFVETPLLLQSHRMNLKKALETFDSVKKPGDSVIIHQHREHVKTELEKLFNKFNEKQKEKIGAKMKQGDELLKTQAEGYTGALKLQAQQVNSVEELEEIHAQAVSNITEKFRRINPFPDDATQHELLNTRLQDQLRLVYDLVKREELDSKRKLQEKLKKVVGKGLETYKKEMDVIKGSSEFLEPETLTEAHETCFNNVISNFHEETETDDGEIVDGHREQLESSMEQRFVKLKTANDSAVLLLKSQAKNWITDCLKEYQDAMRESAGACERSEDFNQEHEKHKFNTVKSFNTKWSAVYKSNGFRGEFIQNLKTEMDELFEELLEMFEIRRSSDNERTTAVKEEARKYYHEEMEKHLKNHQFVQPKILANLHEKASQSAVSRCVAKTPLKEIQITQLKQALQKSYQKYQDENTMILNWELGSEPAIGIDLGTTYCCVAVFFKGKTIVVRNAEGRYTTPSYVAFSPDGSYTIGHPAKDNAFRNPENTVYDAKRIIGRNMQDEQLKNDMNYWPFNVVNGAEGPAIEIYGKQYPPEQIAAFLLKQLVAQAEKVLGVTVRRAVVTVPAYFTDAQRAATVDAGEMAGLEVLQILDEPTAAALAYKLERFYEDARKVLIFDLGGGTFDISILEIDGSKIRVLNKDGDTHLGGEDFDKAMMEYCSNEFKRQHGVDPFQGKDSTQKQEKDAAKQRLRRLQTYCERGKIDLAASPSTVISVDAFFNAIDLNVTVTRQKFEELNASLFKKALEIVERSLKQINLSKAEIDDIVLVGGSTRIPKVQQMLSEYFDGKALNHTVNPDEAVAYGAAVQAALLNGGEAKQLLPGGSIEDVTPMSIGIEAIIDGVTGVFSPIIRKNSTIPTLHKEVYRTHKDNQESAMVRIYQGEAPMAKDNKLLGEFALRGIPKAPAGKECIEINMEIDAMGVLNVKAVVKSTRGQESLTVNENKPGRMSRTTKQRLLEEVQSA